MTDREKLREVINQWLNDPIPFDETFDYGTMLTDYLISKGVTIPVRCGECVHAVPLDRNCELNSSIYMHCNQLRGELENNVWHKYKKYYKDYSLVDRDDFCSYGEREEDDR